MNINEIKRNIRRDKAAMKQAENRINRLLTKYPDYKREFNAIIQKHKSSVLGAPWFQMPVNSLSAVEESAEKAWYESDLVSDLFNFGAKIITHERISEDEQRQLELELAQIEQKNAALDKQITLQKALERSGTMTRSVKSTLSDNPMTIPLLAGLGALWFFVRRKK